MSETSLHPDIYGLALYDYLMDNDPQDIVVHSDVTEVEVYPTEVFFRNHAAFPRLERIAMKHCRGKLLDIGAGSGIHSLYLAETGLEVHPIDTSGLAVKVMQKLGLSNALKTDFFEMKNEKFDTLLIMMNGFGVMGTLNRVPEFFAKAKQLLYPGGQIIADSSNLIYLFEEEDGTVSLDLSKGYYGEVTYQMEYKGQKGHPFKWLFVDYDNLAHEADLAGFDIELLAEGENNHYLAKLSLRS